MPTAFYCGTSCVYVPTYVGMYAGMYVCMYACILPRTVAVVTLYPGSLAKSLRRKHASGKGPRIDIPCTV